MQRQAPVVLPVGGEGIGIGLFIDGTGDAAAGVVPVGRCLPVPSRGLPEELGLGPKQRQVAVLPRHDGVVSPVVAFVREAEILHMEAVASVGSGKRRLDTGREAFPQRHFQAGRGRHGAKGAAAQLEADAAPADRCAAQVQGAGAAVFAGALQQLGALSLVQFHLLQPVRKEAAQVHLHVLGVLDGHSVQEDGRVGAAQTAHIDGLEPAGAAVIPDLDAGEIADGVGQVVLGAEAFAAQTLRRRRHGPERRNAGSLQGVGLLQEKESAQKGDNHKKVGLAVQMYRLFRENVYICMLRL